jgi:hypothetical protein
MRTLTLELLRHGPAHNQLLSPLTPYLALCENHPAVTLQMPLEHNQLLHRLGALSYQLGDASRSFQLHDTARLMADLLGHIPGLGADMARPGNGPSPDPTQAITHLRLVLSASELALLPFELALSPPGCPGTGQPLLLQSQSPVCITRETRRVPETQLVWPSETRVLFAVASPAGAEPVPALAHLLALRERIEPWVIRPDQLGQHLTVLSHASLEAIEAACAATPFTHVHILAHGGEVRDGYDTRFGLMLHRAGDPDGEADVVSGERLASALRTTCRGATGSGAARLRGPAVVTLASCNSGAVGSVAGVGASIAHALHQAGIPLVVASQFPLSFGGSVRMVEALYGGLLWGEDPRGLLVDLRRQLHAEFPASHDWASLTAYSSLPADFNAQLATAQIQRAMTSIDVALNQADTVVGQLPPIAPLAPLRPPPRSKQLLTAAAAVPKAAEPTTAALMAALDAAIQRVRAAKQRLQATMERHDSQRIRILGLLASTEKREAALSHQRQLRTRKPAERDAQRAAMWASLARSRALYFQCYGHERVPYWTTQYLSLTVVLRAGGQLDAQADSPGRDTTALWNLAEVQALHDLDSAQRLERAWALGNLIELYLLAPAINGLAKRGAGWDALAASHARLLADGAAEGAFEVFSTRRQVQRYLDWFARLGADAAVSTLPAGLLTAANAVLAALPVEPPAGWHYGTG